jgi:N-carbamoyl-L-amino-acid hydrolase
MRNVSARTEESEVLSIDGERMIRDLRALADFGGERPGVHRPAFSPQDIASRNWLVERFSEAGLEAEIDGIGNVIARSPTAGPRLLLGSHTDSQPHGGWLDGAMGVVYGLEIARAVAADPSCAGYGVDVASWSDEEGQYSDLLGSKSFCGLITESDIDRITHRDQKTPLRAALDRAGLAGRARVKFGEVPYCGYLEAHIEQGPDLDNSGQKLGIVTSIVGNYNFVINFEGVQNHAGTTRMSIRKDAGVALIRLAAAIDQRFPEVAADRSVWTIGNVMLIPGAKSIIPERAEMWFQFRDTDRDRLASMESLLNELVDEASRGSCKVVLTKRSQTVPQAMDGFLRDRLEAAAERHAPGMHVQMPSGAGHDAQILAKCMPAAMLFVPSIGGVSHHHAEDTAEADLILGCQVLATAASDVLQRASKRS